MPDNHHHRGKREQHKRMTNYSRSRSRENSREKCSRRRSRSRERRDERVHRRNRESYRSNEDRAKREQRNEDEARHPNKRKIMRMEPPAGGWDKPSWEPTGVLVKKELKSEPTVGGSNGEEQQLEREKPSFEPSGKLAQDTNTYKGVLIKYNEPPEAKIPKLRWRMYPFKGQEELPVIYIHRQSAYLIGRDRKISDFPIDHPSCSKQHAVLQYRSLPYERSDGTSGRRTRPYIIDLGSGNGTYLNGQRIESQRYYELKENDVLKFGFSLREYDSEFKGTIHFAVRLRRDLVLAIGRDEKEEDTGSEEEEDEVDQVIDRTGVEEKLANAEEDDLF